MSNSDSYSGTDERPKQLFCEHCNRTVLLVQPDSSKPYSCPRCNHGFDRNEQEPGPVQDPEQVHESHPVQEPDQVHEPDPVQEAVQEPRIIEDQSSSSSSSGNPLELLMFCALFEHFQSNDEALQLQLNPILFIERNIGHAVLLTHIRVEIEDRTPHCQILFCYLQEILQRFPEARERAPRPASKSVVDMLPTFMASEELLNSDSDKCAVCREDFKKGNELKELPCKHVYHKDCILPWFERRSTCPVCRLELPNDDQVQRFTTDTISLELRFTILEDDTDDDSTQENPDGSEGTGGS